MSKCSMWKPRHNLVGTVLRKYDAPCDSAVPHRLHCTGCVSSRGQVACKTHWHRPGLIRPSTPPTIHAVNLPVVADRQVRMVTNHPCQRLQGTIF
jgi:hypothetical protein